MIRYSSIRQHRPCGLLTVIVLSAVVFSCSYWPPYSPLLSVAPKPHLTPSEQVAGEILAYLMEVVLGKAGPVAKRNEWAVRGVDLPLDFDMVTKRMFGPVPLRAELMVLDTNILGLSEVLYHYDKRLNLFKGTREQDSLYPCTELIAIRLLLLQKLHRNEKVSMSGIDRHINLFSPDSRDAAGAELEAMQLSATEFRFLKQIFVSEPAFLHYMRHPFIVAALRKIGVVEQDPFTLAADLTATYHYLSCPKKIQKTDRGVTVAIVASINPMFEQTPGRRGLVPTEAYLTLQRELQHAVRKRVERGGRAGPEMLTFFMTDRPVVIVPESAERVMEQLCPQANFTMVLMGKNVYRGLSIDPDRDILPKKNFLYFDVDDVKYQMVDEEIDALAQMIQSFPLES